MLVVDLVAGLDERRHLERRGLLVGGSGLLRQVQAGRWYPFAKGFGQLLNLNCMLLLLPVIRSLVAWLHNNTSRDKLVPLWLRWVPHVLPVRMQGLQPRTGAVL